MIFCDDALNSAAVICLYQPFLFTQSAIQAVAKDHSVVTDNEPGTGTLRVQRL